MKRSKWTRGALPLLAGAVVFSSVGGALPAAAQQPAKRTPSRPAVRPAQRVDERVGDRVTIPTDTVVRVKLDEALSSRTARQGDRFTATLARDDRSGFPEGTLFEGTVSEVQRKEEDKPGVLDMQFTRAKLPDGRSVSLNGKLASLAGEDVRRAANGRLEARRRSGSKDRFDPKWVGYGAAGGAVLATVFGSNFLKGALLGGLGGAIYGYLNRDRDRDRRDFRDVTLDNGTEFGIRLAQNVAFNEGRDFRYAAREDDYYDRPTRNDRPSERTPDRRGSDQQVLGTRNEYRFAGTSVILDNRPVDLRELKPMNINGQLYVPLAPLADAAGWKLRHREGDDYFSLTTRTGRQAEGYAGDPSVSLGNNQTERLEDEPVLVDGDVFVPTEFLNRIGEMRVNWNRSTQRLELQSARQP